MDEPSILDKALTNQICRLCLNFEDERYFSLFDVIEDFNSSPNEALTNFRLIREMVNPRLF